MLLWWLLVLLRVRRAPRRRQKSTDPGGTDTIHVVALDGRGWDFTLAVLVPAQGNVCQTIWAASSAGGCDSCNCSCCYISPTSSNHHHHLHNPHQDHNHQDHNHQDHRNHQQHHHHKHQQTMVNTIFITKASKIELGSWQSCLNRFPPIQSWWRSIW